MTAISLQAMSGGRFLLGIGPSGPQVIEGWHGEVFGKPLKRTREYVAIIRQIFAREKPLEFQGEFYQVSGCKMHPRPVQETIPVVWGGHSEAAIKRVAKVGDGWKSPAGTDIIWRTRSKDALGYLAKVITDESIKDHNHPRFMRAFDFHPESDEKKKALESLLDL